MPQTITEQYMETEVLHADPVKLVTILYRAASEAVAAARIHLAAGAIRERSRQITRAWAILSQLSLTLNHQKGGDISRRLAELYAYMQTRLIQANAGQIDPPLAEVEALLATFGDAWRSIPSPAAEVSPSAPPPGYVPLSCSF
jgi:flagellar protein FliS